MCNSQFLRPIFTLIKDRLYKINANEYTFDFAKRNPVDRGKKEKYIDNKIRASLTRDWIDIKHGIEGQIEPYYN